ncbi:hypothetical protein GWK47_009951 [Chionoecetes opilio]|uniref:DUF7027 domain-containing protein n=1 Tax=Chionoecetes opilio TaxID=41210 RepID=A0A8J4Y2R9_CHIOP|nr:hypothetical protein GWK47_009951 [Chionoecetes opilio]
MEALSVGAAFALAALAPEWRTCAPTAGMMRRCCGCCISLHKGVVAIGVLGMFLLRGSWGGGAASGGRHPSRHITPIAASVCAAVLSVGYGAVAFTLEEHLEACRNGEARDLLGVLPPCHDLSDTTKLLAVRIFVYAQVSVWLLFFTFSILLIVAAVKERGGLLVPWLVLSVVVTAAVVWSGVRAALQQRTLDLLASVVAVVVVTYCCLVVRSYGRLIKKQALVSVRVPSTYTHPPCCHHPVPSPGPPTCRGRSGLPPAYTPRPTTNPNKKSPLPTGLGIKI